MSSPRCVQRRRGFTPPDPRGYFWQEEAERALLGVALTVTGASSARGTGWRADDRSRRSSAGRLPRWASAVRSGWIGCRHAVCRFFLSKYSRRRLVRALLPDAPRHCFRASSFRRLKSRRRRSKCLRRSRCRSSRSRKDSASPSSRPGLRANASQAAVAVLGHGDGKAAGQAAAFRHGVVRRAERAAAPRSPSSEVRGVQRHHRAPRRSRCARGAWRSRAAGAPCSSARWRSWSRRTPRRRSPASSAAFAAFAICAHIRPRQTWPNRCMKS